MDARRPPMRGRRHDSIGLPGGRRHNDPDPAGTHVAVAGQSHTDDRVADELKQTAKPHDARINVDQEREVKDWSEKFGVSGELLRSAVAKVGSMLKNVRKHLQQRS